MTTPHKDESMQYASALKRAHELILRIEDVLPDEVLELIDVAIWNAVTSDMRDHQPKKERNEMTTAHKDADKLIAIAHGKQMQIYGNDGTPWVDTNPDRALVAICAGEPCRVKPQTIMVNGVECPKPEFGKAAHYAVTVTIPLLFKDHTVHFSTAVDALSVYQALIKPFKECKE